MFPYDRGTRRKRRMFACSFFPAAILGGLCWYWPTVSLGQALSGATRDSFGQQSPKASAAPAELFAGAGEKQPSPVSIAADARAATDMFCGPRCVQFVLAHFGQREELYDLIQEIQERDWRRGASLASIETALRRRGVHTAAMRIDDGAVLSWPHPVVVHMRGRGTNEIGHFVVQLPRVADSETRYWCGLAGIQTLPVDETGQLRSGAVLLTSPAEITSPYSAAISRRGSPLALTLVASALALGIALTLPGRIRSFLFPPREK